MSKARQDYTPTSKSPSQRLGNMSVIVASAGFNDNSGLDQGPSFPNLRSEAYERHITSFDVKIEREK
jgi:hypothetical protein